MNIYFISDTHFSHKNIVKGQSDWSNKEACRDFQTIEEHDNYILEQINKKVKTTDILYHLGDFGFGFNLKEKLIELREKIKCETIHLILGNHDHVIENSIRFSREKPTEPTLIQSEKTPSLVTEFDKNLIKYKNAQKIFNLFKSISYIKFGKIGGRFMCLCHYAMKTWPWQHQGSINLYGHSHGNLIDDINSLSLDIGIDTCLYGHEKYTPYNIEEIFYIIDTYKKYVPLDHHL